MLSVLLSWLYIAAVCLFTGCLVWHLLRRFFAGLKPGVTELIVTGAVVITVLAEYISIFTGIRANMQVCCLFLACFGAVLELGLSRKGSAEPGGSQSLLTLAVRRTDFLHGKFLPAAVLFVLFCLFLSFYTSRGDFHVDSLMYHINNIRVYEEVGLMKGMANIQWQFGYNSAYLAFASVFSFGWLFKNPLHTTTGFLELVFGWWAIAGLLDFRSHRHHFGDAGRLSILIYILNILVRSMSPATDFGALLFAAFVIADWMSIHECSNSAAIENAADAEQQDPVLKMAFLSVLSTFVLTLKVSAALLVLAALVPGIRLLRKKEWKKVLAFLGMGIVIVLPFLIRNYYISGWLIYPFTGINLFHVDWKVPASIAEHDAAQIKTWGRGLNDAARIDTPMREWIPVWWDSLQYYEKTLMKADLMSMVILLWQFLRAKRRKKPLPFVQLSMLLVILLSMTFWFIEASFIRYGLVFLLYPPAAALFLLLDQRGWDVSTVFCGLLAGWMIFFVTPFLDNYFEDATTFAHAHFMENEYLIFQKEYPTQKTIPLQVGKFTVQAPDWPYDYNNYSTFPSTSYDFEALMCTSRGETLRDGFRNVEVGQ